MQQLKSFTVTKIEKKIAPVTRPAVPRGMAKTFRRHLEQILPLSNPSNKPCENEVLDYIRHALTKAGRVWEEDGVNNIVALGNRDSQMPWSEPRSVVAHTDSVMQTKGRMDVTLSGGIYTGDGQRPIGGDDKVGVAVALAIAEHCPHFGAIFTSDEETGGRGADRVDIPHHSLLVECDRRGAADLVTCIMDEIMSEDAVCCALHLLPHREEVQGMFTDVDTLMGRGLSDNACNMSCGYYHPHTKSEIVVLTEATQALLDAHTLLAGMPADADRAVYHPLPYHGLDVDLDGCWICGADADDEMTDRMGNPICPRCADNLYESCWVCGCLQKELNNNGLCEGCAREIELPS